MHTLILHAGLTKGMKSDSNTQGTKHKGPCPSALVAPGKFVELPVYFILLCVSC